MLHQARLALSGDLQPPQTCVEINETSHDLSDGHTSRVDGENLHATDQTLSQGQCRVDGGAPDI